MDLDVESYKRRNLTSFLRDERGDCVDRVQRLGVCLENVELLPVVHDALGTDTKRTTKNRSVAD